jgi:CDP-paratose synthetase
VSVALISGATGFLGGHLTRYLLAEGITVHFVHRAESSTALVHELVSQGAVAHAFEELSEVAAIAATIDPDYLFHLATHYLKDHTPADVAPLVDANVTFGAQLLEGVAGSDTIVVSAMSYFQFNAGVPTPFSLYSATKQAFFDVCEFYRARRGLDIRQVVLYDTFGPGDVRDKLIPRLIGAVGADDLVSMGNSSQALNVLYCDDVASGMLAAAAADAPPIMALRSHRNYSVGEIVAAIEQIAGAPFSKSFNEDAPTNDLVEVAGTWPAPPGWRDEVSLDHGLREVLRQSAL